MRPNGGAPLISRRAADTRRPQRFALASAARSYCPDRLANREARLVTLDRRGGPLKRLLDAPRIGRDVSRRRNVAVTSSVGSAQPAVLALVNIRASFGRCLSALHRAIMRSLGLPFEHNYCTEWTLGWWRIGNWGHHASPASCSHTSAPKLLTAARAAWVSCATHRSPAIPCWPQGRP